MDTRDKRASSIFAGSPWRTTLPVADGSLSQGDRQHVSFLYRGIAATVVVVTVNPNAIRLDLIGSASRFTLKGSPARAGKLEGSEARSG